jgi:hypothetical protein
MNLVDEALLKAYYRFSAREHDYLVHMSKKKSLSSEERRVIDYLLAEQSGEQSGTLDRRLDSLIRADQKQAAIDSTWGPVNKTVCTAEGVLLGCAGLGLVVILPGVAPSMAAVSLLSLLGMVSVRHSEVTRKEEYADREVVRWLIIAMVTIALIGTAIAAVWLPVWDAAVDVLVSSGSRPNRFGVLFLYAIFALLIACCLAVGYFLGMRLFLFCFSVYRKGLIATLRMVPIVWVSRGFLRSVFDSPEIVPGYPAGKTPYSKAEGVVPVGNIYLAPIAIAIPAVGVVFSIIAFVAGLAFKLTLFYLWPLAYLAQILNIKSEEGNEFVSREYRSRFAMVSLFIAVGVFAIAAIRAVLILNFDVLVAGTFLEDRARDLVMSIHLWTAVSLVSALVLFFTTRQVDQLFSAIKDQGMAAAKVMPGIRVAMLGVRVRQFLIVYTVLCTVTFAIPWLRDSVFPFLNPMIWRVE